MRRLFSSWVAVALIASVPLLTACATNDGPDYEARVNETLETANLDDVNADWREEERQLRLTGEVRSAADRTRAEELARQVVGTTGQVVNDITIAGSETAGTGGTAIPGTGTSMDDQIEERLDRLFREDDEWDMDKLDLNFDAENGVVTITGDAPSQAVKDRVTARVRKVEGVKDVINNLEIQKQ